MEYRNYDEDRSGKQNFIHRNVRYFRPVGLVFIGLGLIAPFLMAIHVIQSTYILNFISYILLFLGPCLLLIGLAYEGYVSRTK